MTDRSIQQALEQDAQVISERIPTDMTKQKANDAAKWLREFMDERQLSQAKVAQLIDVSSSTLSQFLAGKYKGDIEGLTNKLVNLINTMTRREKRVRGEAYVETTVAKRIATLITQTESFSDEDEGKIGLVVGDGGHGKSHCLRAYAKANKNTVYVQLDDAMYSTLIFSEIAEKLGIDSSGTLANVTRRLIDSLQNRQIIIMLDEASSLTVRQLNQLRQIIVVKSRCPLVLAGNRHLLTTVMQPTSRRGFESLDQFTSRLMYILDLDSTAADKDGGLYTPDDIRKLYQYGGIRLTGGAVGILRKISKTPRTGRLRTCGHIITAMHISKKIREQGYIDAPHILWAIEQLDLPVKVHLPVVSETAETAEEVEKAAVKTA